MKKKTLAVIGGGAAGHQIAHDLKDVMAVTMVDPKTYWEVPMAFPRLLVEPNALPARMAYRDFLGGARHVQGHAVAISGDAVTVQTAAGETIVPFDYAVIATGSRYLDSLIKAEALTEESRAAEIGDAHQRLKAARSVVVAGGGPVGVEVAAELRETLPHIDVTLVHKGERLLDTAPHRFAGWGSRSLTKLGVTVVLGDLVAEPAIGHQPTGGVVRLGKGGTIPADVVVWAVGAKPATDFVKKSWPSLVDAAGLLKTDSFLRLQGHPNIFVSGDVTNLPERRLVITASFHVTSIVKNLKVIAAAASPSKAQLKAYSPAVPGKGMGKLMVVTLGRTDGLTSLPFGQFRASFMARAIKSKDMFVPKYRKMVGLG